MKEAENCFQNDFHEDFMMDTLPQIKPEALGLFELNDAGEVLYCKNIDKSSYDRLTEAVGRNFFDEVAPFDNTEEFRRLLNRFIKSDSPSESFTFDCRIGNQIVPTKIMLVRISERAGGGAQRVKSTIVDIRKI